MTAEWVSQGRRAITCWFLGKNRSPDAYGPIEASGIFVIFLSFFMYQIMFGEAVFVPFRDQGPKTEYPPVYIYHSVMSAALFLGLIATFLFRGRRAAWGDLCVGLICIGTPTYLALTVGEILPTDRSEALSIALNQITHGLFPYTEVTRLGSPITPLTTSFILAIPGWWIAGRPEFGVLPMLVIAFCILAWKWNRSESPVKLSWIACSLFLNPIIVWEILWRGDLVWGSVLLLLAVALLDADKLRAAGIVMGLTLCTRASIVLLLPMWIVFLFRRKRAHWISSLVWTGCVVLALELPFVLWNPDCFFHFAPFGVSTEKLSGAPIAGDSFLGDYFLRLFPEGHGRTYAMIVAIGTLSAGLGAWSRRSRDLAFAQAALLGAIFFLMGPHFMVDYLVWLFPPVLYVLASGNEPAVTYG